MKERMIITPYMIATRYTFAAEINKLFWRLPEGVIIEVWDSQAFSVALNRLRIRMNWKFLAGIYNKK
jgi:hypothetical protein